LKRKIRSFVSFLSFKKNTMSFYTAPGGAPSLSSKRHLLPSEDAEGPVSAIQKQSGFSSGLSGKLDREVDVSKTGI
jgi:hypothetical protein